MISITYFTLIYDDFLYSVEKNALIDVGRYLPQDWPLSNQVSADIA